MRALVSASLMSLLAVGQVSAGELGWVGMSGTDTLVPFDLDTGSPMLPSIGLLPEGDYPYDVSIHPSGEEVWVCGASGDGVVAVATGTATVAARIDLTGVAEYPVDVQFDRDGGIAWVSGRDSDQVALVDVATHTLTGTTVPISASGLGPGKMAVHPSTGEMFVADWFGSRLHRVDPTTLAVTTQTIGSGLWDLVVSPDGAVVYVTDRSTDQVRIVDAATLAVLQDVPVGDDPWGIDVTPDGAQLFVANEDSADVTVIDTATLATQTITLPGGADPRDVDIRSDGTLAYVPSGSLSGNDAVYVIDTVSLTVVDTLDLGSADVNANVIGIAPEGVPGLFSDGFESGDTTAWSATVP